MEGLLGRLDERERPTTAFSTEVIIINGSEHDSTQVLVYNILSFLSHNGLVFETNPRIALVCVRIAWASGLTNV